MDRRERKNSSSSSSSSHPTHLRSRPELRRQIFAHSTELAAALSAALAARVAVSLRAEPLHRQPLRKVDEAFHEAVDGVRRAARRGGAVSRQGVAGVEASGLT